MTLQLRGWTFDVYDALDPRVAREARYAIENGSCCTVCGNKLSPHFHLRTRVSLGQIIAVTEINDIQWSAPVCLYCAPIDEGDLADFARDVIEIENDAMR
jgi:hypothetical protein